MSLDLQPLVSTSNDSGVSPGSSSEGDSSAGILPYTVYNGEVHFLFQTPSSGRKMGFFMDFGGSKKEGDADLYCTAVREFCEETACCFFVDKDSLLSTGDVTALMATEDVQKKMEGLVEKLKTPEKQQIWHCVKFRRFRNNYHFFIVPFPYLDPAIPTKAFSNHSSKKRTYQWIPLSKVQQQLTRTIWHRLRAVSYTHLTLPTICSV
eukprot:TRINITY_DN4583_c0_g1_i1.p1 TRINITY_DN4583_c0_g1~~TRINITY_DN4583_c0_g1_i1.p1  ORF type:complete len:207 (-),score=26.86 TRINITY_DN4583_c0_g1_i1:22-642(-)